MTEVKEKKQASNKRFESLIMILLVVGLVFTIINQFQLLSIDSSDPVSVTGMVVAQDSIIPTGMPKIYGEELGINYDDVSPNDPRLADSTIGIMGDLDRTITLQGEDLERYIDVTSQISCEYCCGAQSIIVSREEVKSMDKKIEAAIASGQLTEEQAENYRRNAGDSACGCAHSYAMRGLSKYLVTEQGNEFSDEEILEELAKWKTLFFPSQMAAKAAVMEEEGIEFSYANLGSNRYRGIEAGTSGSGMVGGC